MSLTNSYGVLFFLIGKFAQRQRPAGVFCFCAGLKSQPLLMAASLDRLATYTIPGSTTFASDAQLCLQAPEAT
jgi:hypothetical protein